jgi:hypothetical protein
MVWQGVNSSRATIFVRQYTGTTFTQSFLNVAVNPDAPEWEIPLKRAKPWRALARKGDIYRTTSEVDPGSLDRTQF